MIINKVYYERKIFVLDMTSRSISMKLVFLRNRISELLIGQVPFSRRVAGLRSGDANRAAKSDAVDYYPICLTNKNFYYYE